MRMTPLGIAEGKMNKPKVRLMVDRQSRNGDIFARAWWCSRAVVLFGSAHQFPTVKIANSPDQNIYDTDSYWDIQRRTHVDA